MQSKGRRAGKQAGHAPFTQGPRHGSEYRSPGRATRKDRAGALRRGGRGYRARSTDRFYDTQGPYSEVARHVGRLEVPDQVSSGCEVTRAPSIVRITNARRRAGRRPPRLQDGMSAAAACRPQGTRHGAGHTITAKHGGRRLSKLQDVTELARSSGRNDVPNESPPPLPVTRIQPLARSCALVLPQTRGRARLWAAAASVYDALRCARPRGSS